MEYKTFEYYIPHALALDFDRTLGDVEACMARFYDVAELFDVRVEEVSMARIQTENDGGSFSPLSYIRDRLPVEVYRQFCQQFIQAEGPSVLYDDAVRFLAMLQYSDVPHIVLTYGVDSEWQQLKIAASRYQVGVIIMEHTDKGIVMNTLRAPDGSYRFSIDKNATAVYIAASMCLIDDKIAAFKSLPSGCVGVRVRRAGLISNQQGDLPPGVVTITSLDELMINESGRLALRANQDEYPPYNMERRCRYLDSDMPFLTAVYRSLVVR